MKFSIRRASVWPGDWPADQIKPSPCDGCTYENDEWHIDIQSLEALLDLVKMVGRLIVDKKEIIIYDDYQE